MLVSGFIRRLKRKTLRNPIIPTSIITLLLIFIYDQSVTNNYEPKSETKNKKAKKEVRVFMPGLDNAGTTTMLYRLKVGKVLRTIHTSGLNAETIEYKGREITIVDVGGCENEYR